MLYMCLYISYRHWEFVWRLKSVRKIINAYTGVRTPIGVVGPIFELCFCRSKAPAYYCVCVSVCLSEMLFLKAAINSQTGKTLQVSLSQTPQINPPINSYQLLPPAILVGY